MRILVVGTWNPHKAKEYISQAQEVGFALAKREHILVASPSSGFQGLVANCYKQNNGRHFIGYYPDFEFMRKIGEEVLVEPDEKIYTEQDYPLRNILQIKGSDAVIGVTGGLGTLTELLVAVNDYELPTSFYQGSSPLVDGFLRLDKDFAQKVHSGSNVNRLIDYLDSRSMK